MISRSITGERRIRSALVTGATGFIGLRLVHRLLQEGASVKALVRAGSAAPSLDLTAVRIIRGDLRDVVTLLPAVEDVDTVFHCGAVTGPAYAPAEVFRKVNHLGTVNLLTACSRAIPAVERFVHVSTAAVVGPVKHDTVAGEDALTGPVDCYGATKLLAENEAAKAASERFVVAIARVMWTYGPGSSGAARLFRLIARGRLPIIGSGRNTIQPIWLDDAIDALLACARRPVKPGAIYNVAGPSPLSISHLCSIIASATGGSIPSFHVPLPLVAVAAAICERTFPRIGLAPPLDHQKVDFFRVNHAYSIQRAAEELCWEPKIDFPEGSLRMAGWMRERRLL